MHTFPASCSFGMKTHSLQFELILMLSILAVFVSDAEGFNIVVDQRDCRISGLKLSSQTKGAPTILSLERSPSKDHPRGCREHVIVLNTLTGFPASSPRMQGTRLEPGAGDPLARIIPADAWNTIAQYASNAPTGDHPRGCREHPSRSSPIRTPDGSSPRMRGTLLHRLMQAGQSRIIPADAENTR